MPSTFTPQDYITLARTLAADTSDEVKLRAAVGRAYYGIFLLVKTKANIVDKVGVHAAATRAVAGKSFSAGSYFNSLRLMRVHADYDLKPRDSDYDSAYDDWLNNWKDAEVQIDNLLDLIDTW